VRGGQEKQGGLQAPKGGGQSQGGAWPGQEKARRSKPGADGSLGHGGQSVQAYHGPSNPNATSKEDE
jgi:hypothetical protein